MKKKEDFIEEVTMGVIVKSLWERFKIWFKELPINVSIMDLVNFHKFKREFDEEETEPESLYHKFHLKRNKIKTIIYGQYNFDDRDLMYADYDSRKMLFNKVGKIVKYMTDDMGWGEYLHIDIMNFEDENGEPTLSYGVTFTFIPKQFSIGWLFKWIGIILATVAIGFAIGYSYYFLLTA